MTKEAPMTNDQEMKSGDPNRPVYDLGERTAVFGESVIAFARQIHVDAVAMPVISQLVRAATSVGANYCEADEADSRKEFRYRISLCKREAKETRFHLRMMVAACPACKTQARVLWQEAKELTLIFSAILRKKRES